MITKKSNLPRSYRIEPGVRVLEEVDYLALPAGKADPCFGQVIIDAAERELQFFTLKKDGPFDLRGTVKNRNRNPILRLSPGEQVAARRSMRSDALDETILPYGGLPYHAGVMLAFLKGICSMPRNRAVLAKLVHEFGQAPVDAKVLLQPG